MKDKFLLLLIILIFISAFRFARADTIKEPDIITINNQLLVYAQVADKIVKNAQVNNLKINRINEKEIIIEVKEKTNLVMRLIKLRNEAKKSGWIFDKCENDSTDNEMGIELDNKRGLIKDIMLCNKNL